MFEGIRLNAGLVLKVLYRHCEGQNNTVIHQELNVGRPAIKRLLDKVKYFIQENVRLRMRNLVGGNGDWVEVDETHLVSRRDGRGRILTHERYWVIGCVSRATKRLAVCLVRRRDANTCLRFVSDNVARGSNVVTDGWRGYRRLVTLGYNHFWVDHSREFVNREDPNIHTNTIESMWSVLKRNLPNFRTFEDYEKYIFWWTVEKNLSLLSPNAKFQYFLSLNSI
jgi:IS1 family transposase